MMKTRKKSLIAHFRARACRFEDCLVPPVSMPFMTLIYSNIYVGIIDSRVFILLYYLWLECNHFRPRLAREVGAVSIIKMAGFEKGLCRDFVSSLY